MNADTVKIELIDWIATLSDEYSISKILSLKKELSATSKTKAKIFGSGKHLFEFISDDFNEPVADFNEYQ
ncbi:MAG: type II toxin-antitoxin system prevent-host-death family antitoxin [Bacteroidota bacterium]|nr:type II toxin-antitoxin system prevent-host-death family antitoxin [Bacteroidota bacterium]